MNFECALDEGISIADEKLKNIRLLSKLFAEANEPDLLISYYEIKSDLTKIQRQCLIAVRKGNLRILPILQKRHNDLLYQSTELLDNLVATHEGQEGFYLEEMKSLKNAKEVIDELCEDN